MRQVTSARLVAKKERMARASMTLDEIRATRPMADTAKIAATTDADIRRHQIEDGEDPDAPLPPFRPTPNVREIRTRPQMTSEAFVTANGVPVAAVRNWEQSRTNMDPAVRSLLRVVERERDARRGHLRDDRRAALGHERASEAMAREEREPVGEEACRVQTGPYYGSLAGRASERHQHRA